MLKRMLAPLDGTRQVGTGLLVLRLWFGLSMAFLHGITKLQKFNEMKGGFLDLFGIGSSTSLVLAIFAEFLCGILLAAGLFTRFAALALAFTMGVAFFVAHKGALSGAQSGEMAFIYLGAYVALVIAGPGRFSLDALLRDKQRAAIEEKK